MAKRSKRKKAGWRGNVLLIGFVIFGFVFHALAVILIVGMLPTLVAAIIDQSKYKFRTITVGAMNFAGCTPFLLEVFSKGNNLDIALNFLIQPLTIVVMFTAAGMGYLIDWALTGIVSSIMVQRAKGRIKDIEAHQKELIERWGAEVSGTIPLDEFGFAKERPFEGQHDDHAMQAPH